MSYFCSMESNRQKKIASVLQRDLVDILQGSATKSGMQGIIISVTKVKVTVDLSNAKAYLSIFPTKHAPELMAAIKLNSGQIRHEVAQRTKNQLRRMPELEFFLDDSLEYIDQIDRSLKGLDNPLDNPELLDKRKKK